MAKTLLDPLSSELGHYRGAFIRDSVTAVAKQPTGTTLTRIWDTDHYLVTL